MKVADLGLSREVENTSEYYKIQTSVCLPLRWMAPETLASLKFTKMTVCRDCVLALTSTRMFGLML